MPRFVIDEARPEDDAELRALFRVPMAGSIAIASEREPNYFRSAAVQNEEPLVFVGRDTERGGLAGVFSVGRRRVFVDGRPRALPYFCDLRILPAFRQGTLLARGYRFVRERVLDGDDLAQTIVIADNLVALEALTSGRGGLPVYHPYGEYHTYAVNIRSAARSRDDLNCMVRRATGEDLPAIQAFLQKEAPRKQFYPVYDFTRLQGPGPVPDYYADIRIEDFFLAFAGAKLVGLVGVWDQKAFKQTRVISYARSIAYTRPLYNLAARATGGIVLPPAGSLMEYFNLHALLIENDDPGIFAALIAAVKNTYRGGPHEYFLCGLDASDPLNAALGRERHRLIRGRHFLIGFGSDPRPTLRPGPFYLETARI